MKKSLLAAFIFSLSFISAYAQQSGGAPTGAFRANWSPNPSRECAVCHYEWSQPFIAENKGTLIAPFPTTKEVSSERMCFSCHDGSVGDSRSLLWSPDGENHKTGTKLKEGMKPPAILPLADAQITCMTCHTAHGTGDPATKDVQTGLFLRMDNADSQLCKSCHNEMSGKFSHPLRELNAEQKSTFVPGSVKLAENGKVSCDSCHQTHGARNLHLLRQSGEGMQLCRNCHVRQFPQDMKTDDIAMAHLVMLQVDDMEIKEAIVRMSARLGPDGELICFTCHSIHKAQGTNLLVEDNTESRFCRNCHGDYDNILKSTHNMEKQKQYLNDQGKTAADLGVCSTCHGSHRWQERMPVITATPRRPAPDTMTLMCLSCHNPAGVASRKPIRWDMYNHYLGDVDKDRLAIESDPQLAGLPDSAKKFLSRYFADRRPRTMATESTITCMTCHDIHSDGKMFVREEVQTGKLCTDCHEKQKNIENTLHGSEKLTKNCMSCHYVHNAPDERLLISGNRSEGCYACHNDNSTETPPATMREKMPKELVVHENSHPVDIETKTLFRAPMKPNTKGMLTCTSCHNPHEGQDKNAPLKRNFLRGSETGMKRDDFCTACHDANKAVLGSAHAPDPQKTVIAGKRTGRAAETCDLCHKVHNASTKRWIFNISGSYQNANDYCVICHNPEGQAEDKPIDLMSGHMIGKLDKTPKVVKYITYSGGTYSIECRNCHDPHINGPVRGTEGTFTSSFLRKFDTGFNICLGCHDDKDSILRSGHNAANFEKKTPEILAKVEEKNVCGPCHIQHNSNRKTYLTVGFTSEERCQFCHNDVESIASKMAKTSHLMDVDPKDNNTLKLPLENSLVTCGTCHEPHRSVKNLIRPQLANEEMLCVSCHESRRWVSVSYHNMSIAHIKDEKLKEVAAQNACQPCHAAHNFNPEHAFMWARPVNLNRDFIYGICIDCHSSGGISPKVPKYLTHSKLFRMLPTNQQWQQYIYSLKGKMSDEGEVSCSTCHEPHIWSTNPAKVGEAAAYKGRTPLEGDNTTSFLKGSSVVQNFCTLCHDNAEARYSRYHMSDFREKGTEKRGIIERLFKSGE